MATSKIQSSNILFSIFWCCVWLVFFSLLFFFFFFFGCSNFHAGNEEFRTEFKVPPFQDCVLSFLGFSEEEKINMEERTQKHGTELACVSVFSETNLKRFMFSNVTTSAQIILDYPMLFILMYLRCWPQDMPLYFIARPSLLKPDFCLRGIFKGPCTACFVQVDGSRRWVMKGAPTW